jgi:hypothetical protein
MQIFNSPLFWFVEGILCCVMVLGARTWAQDRAIALPWWKWFAFAVWVLLAGFTIAFIGTSFGEGEATAAVRGGLLFGLVVVLAGAGLWRIWLIGVTPRDKATSES